MMQLKSRPMSGSIKKTPKVAITSAESEKDNKRAANRKLRRVTKVKIKKGEGELPTLKDISNTWAFDKDGKQYLKNPAAKELRK